MKKLLLSLSILGAAITAKADVITVSNNSNSPGQYTNLQAAIDDSSPNDTILVHGSATSYGDVTITWPLTLLGAGFNNPYGENTIVGFFSLNRVNASIGASNTKISGFLFSSGIQFNPIYSGGDNTNQILSDIVIERCQFNNYVNFRQSCSFNDITIRNNLFSFGAAYMYLRSDNDNTSSQYTSYNNVSVYNNVFYNSGYIDLYGGDYSGVNFSNNLFLDGGGALFTSPTLCPYPQIVLENNIFYGVDPEGCTNCAFNNNITYQCNDDQLVYAGNINSVGSGNLIGVDPEFEDYPFLGGPFSYAHDYNLETSSPGINAGTDGSDIGLYGGSLPLDIGTNPSIPQMMYVSFPNNSSVEEGGTLDVEFKSHKQD